MICSLIIFIIASFCQLSYTETSVSLTIFPTFPPGYVIRRVGNKLNITCLMNSTDGTSFMNYFVHWEPPHSHTRNALSRITAESLITKNFKSTSLIINSAIESVAGVYTCRAYTNFSIINHNAGTVTANVTIEIKPKRGSCNSPLIECGSGECLLQRYFCDGVRDCKDGSDEDEARCGPNPCDGKITCFDNRCQTMEYCCAIMTGMCHPGNTHICCKDHQIRTLDGTWPPITFTLMPPIEMVDQQHQFDTDMGFLQSTIYTIIGCAVAFVFVVTVLVVAVCRVHMRQNAMIASPMSNHGALLPFRRTLNWNQRFSNEIYIPRNNAFHERLRHIPPPPSSSLLVTYNINNGVQLVGQLADPPPYSEVADPPPCYGPPPPYVSTDDLQDDQSSSIPRSTENRSSESSGQMNDSVV